MTDPRKFLVNTDYPLDQIIYLKTGSFTATGGGGVGTIITFAHNLGFTPLIIGTWSYSSTFSTSKEGGAVGFEGADANSAFTYFDANSTNIRVVNFNPGTTATVYYRIYGFMPSNVNVDVAATNTGSNNFIINTSYNYTKLLLEGTVAASGSDVVIAHNLGYRPQVTTWIGSASGYVGAVTSYGITKVGTNGITFLPSSYTRYYRIYADSQL